MKGITALLLVCALMVFGFGDAFAAKKASVTPATFSQQGTDVITTAREFIPDDSSPWVDSPVPLPASRRANALLVPIVPGTYTIGAAGTYPRLRDAVGALQANGIDSTLPGNIIFEFIDASYNDTSQTIGNYPGQYGSNLVIFRPATGVVATIVIDSGSAANTFGIRLNTANNVVWDGSNNGGTSRDLTIEGDTIGTTINRFMVQLQRGTTNSVIKNMIIKGTRRAASAGNDILRIQNQGLTPAATAPNTGNIIENNWILRGNAAVVFRGHSAAIPDNNNQLIGNLCGAAGIPDIMANLASSAIITEANTNILVSRNEVYGVRVAGAGPFALQARGAVTGLYERNKFHDVNVLAGGGARPSGILVGNTVVGVTASFIKTDITISNNVFYDFHNASVGSGGRAYSMIIWNPTGVPNSTTGNGSTVRLYHNTSWQRYTAADGAAAAGTMFGIDGNFAGSNTNFAQIDSVIIMNNVIATKRDSGFTRQQLWFRPADTLASSQFVVISDNNNWYNFDAGAFAQYNVPWPIGPTAVVNPYATYLTDTGMDPNSVFADPKFVGDFDPHITTALGVISPADSLGAPLGKLVDIDGDARDANFPDAGADEFAPNFVTNEIAAQSIDDPTLTSIKKEFTPFSPVATFRNYGTVTQTNVPVYFQILDNTPAVVYSNMQLAPSIAFLTGTAQVTFDPVVGGLAPGTYTTRAIAANPGDLIASNDTISSSFQVQTVILSSSFPYTEDFEGPTPEGGAPGWLSSGTINDWVIGTPAKPQISAAHSGTKAFVTKVSGDYTANQESFVNAPILDLTSFSGLLLVEFYLNFKTEWEWDGAVLEVSTDAGATYSRVDSTVGTGGNFNTATSVAWYNNPSGLGNISAPFWGGDSGGGTSSADYASAVGGWVRAATVVSGLAGLGDVRFRWHFSADGAVQQEGVAIDDVTFKELNSDDIGMASLGIPGYLGGPRAERPDFRNRAGEEIAVRTNNRPGVKSLGAVVAGGSLDFEAQAQNYGANAQATYSIGLNVDGAAADADANTESLDFGDVDTFTVSWSTPTTGFHTADAWTSLGGDQDASNDTTSFDFEVLAPEVIFYEGFNSDTWPSPGWDTLDVDGNGVEPGASWQQDVIAIYEGAHSAGGFFGQANGTLIDDWLISPNTGSLTDVLYTVDSLSFQIRTANDGPGGSTDYPDSVEVLVSTTDQLPGSFTSLEYFEIPATLAWVKKTYALPNAATRYIAFRYLHYDGGLTGSNSNAFSLDDVRITTYTFANDFAVNPSNVSFGNVPVGFDADEVVEVKNVGNLPLSITSVTSDNADFTVSPSGPLVMAAGDSLDFTITFTPAAEGANTGNIIFTHDGEGGSPDSVYVAGFGGAPLTFLSLSPDSVFNEDPAKPNKSKKLVKRKKGLYPNWSNLLDETNAQGGFGPGTTESDSAGGMVIGKSYMFNAGGPGPAAKWKAVKDSAKIHPWVRLAKWDFKKNIGKSSTNIQKTLNDKGLKHTGPASGIDTTTDGKNKPIYKQLTKLSPKKHSNKLFAELVALKLNIAASAMGKTPAGFGDLIFDVNGNPFDELSILAIADSADQIMTLWQGHTQDELDSLHSAVYNINRAFIGALDTARFEAVDSAFPAGKLVLNGQVNIAGVSYLKVPPMPFAVTRFQELNSEVESPEDWEDAEDEDDHENLPVAAKLYQNYPNPFNPSTTISFQLKEVSNVTIKVYNLLGQEVATLLNGEELDGGFQEFQFDASQISSGVYFYRIDAQGMEDAALRTVETRKMLLIK